MKITTKIFTLLLILIAFSSCNMGKHYANYRVGGKSKLEQKTVIVEKSTTQDSILFAASLNVPILKERIVTDTFMINCFPEKKKEEVINEKKVIKPVPSILEKKTSSKIYNSKKSENKNSLSRKHSSMKSAESLWSSFLVWGLIIGLIVFFISDSIGLGILAALLFLIGGIIAAALVLVLVFWIIGEIIGEIINNSNRSFSKRKNIFPRLLQRNSKSSSTKYYGGLSVSAYFWIGMGVLALLLIGMAIFGASDLMWSIFMSLLVAHLCISLFAAMIVGLMNLFPGMSKTTPKKNRWKKGMEILKKILISTLNLILAVALFLFIAWLYSLGPLTWIQGLKRAAIIYGIIIWISLNIQGVL